MIKYKAPYQNILRSKVEPRKLNRDRKGSIDSMKYSASSVVAVCKLKSVSL